MRWAQAATLLVFLFAPRPAVEFAHADATIVVFAAPSDPDRVRDIEAAENVLRNLGGFQVLPEAAMKIKLQAQGAELGKVETPEQALAIAKQLKADLLVWIDRWSDGRKEISALLANLKSGTRRRAGGKLWVESDDLRDQLVKGVVVAAIQGKALAPAGQNVRPAKVVKEANWGSWARFQNSPDRKGASILLQLDAAGKLKDSWLLETSWPTYGKRAMEVIRRYQFAPAVDGDAPKASYAIIETYCKRQGLKAPALPGEDRIWGQVFIDETKE